MADRGGVTFDPERDGARLDQQHAIVWLMMLDEQWHTLPELERRTRYPKQSISARLRDFRKPRFGGHIVERKYLHQGLWAYRLLINPMS